MPLELCFYGMKHVGFQEQKRVPLKPNEIRVKTQLTGIRHGEDLRVLYRKDWKFPHIPQTWGVGQVVETGANVHAFTEGDTVHGPMVPGEENILQEKDAHAIHWLRPEFCVFMEPGEWGLRCVHASGVKYGDRVAIFGLGAPGLMALQYARASGALEIIAVDPLPSRCQVAQRLGAHYPLSRVELQNGDCVEDCHAVIELSGSAEGLMNAADAILPGGTLVAGGVPYPPNALRQVERQIHPKEGRFVLLPAETIEPSNLKTLVYTSIAEKTAIVWPIHSHTIPFSEVSFAYQKIDEEPDCYRKVLLKYEP